MYEELLEVAVAAAAERPRGVALLNVGSLDLLEGEPARAVRVCAEAVGILSKLGDAETHAAALFNLACALLESGEEEAGARAFEDSARLSLEGGFHESLAYCLVGVAAVAQRRGDSSEAGALLGAAEALLEEMKSALAPYERGLHARTADAVRATLGADAGGVWLAGRRAGPEATLRAALGDKPQLSAE
jgi:tetratricopeptide (TPR) repeat protein